MKYAPELVRESAARSSLRRLRVKKFSNIQSAWAQDMLQCDFSPSNSECLLLILTDFVFNSIFEFATLKSRTELIRYKVPQRSCRFVKLLNLTDARCHVDSPLARHVSSHGFSVHWSDPVDALLHANAVLLCPEAMCFHYF
jgi:hypothetical protein